MRLFERKAEEPKPVPAGVRMAGEMVIPRTEYRIEPTFEEVAAYAKEKKLYGTTEKLRQAYREVKISRIRQAIYHSTKPNDLEKILHAILEVI